MRVWGLGFFQDCASRDLGSLGFRTAVLNVLHSCLGFTSFWDGEEGGSLKYIKGLGGSVEGLQHTKFLIFCILFWWAGEEKL